MASSISTRQPTLPSASPSACGITAATPSSTAHWPGLIGPGRKPRVVLPGTSIRGLAVYCASVEKPSADTRHVGVARASPAAELALAPDRVARLGGW